MVLKFVGIHQNLHSLHLGLGFMAFARQQRQCLPEQEQEKELKLDVCRQSRAW